MKPNTLYMMNSGACFFVFVATAWANSGILGSPWLYWVSVGMAIVCVILFVVAVLRARYGE